MDYEKENKRREREDERRGWSISSGGGWISHVDHRHIDQQAPTKRSDTSKVFDGFACLYGVKHWYKSRWEIFERGCFNGSLNGVFALIDHKFATKKLGDQDDDTLELLDTDVGLAFRLKLTQESLERLDGRDSMSCSYFEHDVETRAIGNDTVRVIKSASLFEISACYVGSVRNTFAVVRDADTVGSLRDEVKNNFAMESASTIFMRALRNIA